MLTPMFIIPFVVAFHESSFIRGRQNYCLNPKANDPCNPVTEAPCCMSETQIATCSHYYSITKGTDPDHGYWTIGKCKNNYYTTDDGIGHCRSTLGCDCNDQCCKDPDCQPAQPYCNITPKSDCDDDIDE